MCSIFTEHFSFILCFVIHILFINKFEFIGADGVLDFGTIKVGEEVKLSVNLKNKGKYEIAYKYVRYQILYIDFQ